MFYKPVFFLANYSLKYNGFLNYSLKPCFLSIIIQIYHFWSKFFLLKYLKNSVFNLWIEVLLLQKFFCKITLGIDFFDNNLSSSIFIRDVSIYFIEEKFS